jgi:glycosyltransferase involved in cell wall biosynthesis
MDRLKDIIDLLDSVKVQAYPNIETVFIAERSRELFERVKDYAQEKDIGRMIAVFNDSEPGASAARNMGIKQANGEIIAFVDDDAILFPDWAEEMVKTYENDSIIGVTGLSYPLWECSAANWLPEEFHWLISCTGWSRCTEITDARNIWLQNASFRREAFKLAGYIDLDLGPKDGVQGFKGREFKEGIISEEVELSLRVKKATGKRIVCNPHVKIRHKVYNNRLKLNYIARWAYWTGFTKHKTKRLYPQADADVLSQEHELLVRIITKLLPGILKRFFYNPAIACRQFFVTIIALFFVALGYFSHCLSSFRENRKIMVKQEGG